MKHAGRDDRLYLGEGGKGGKGKGRKGKGRKGGGAYGCYYVCHYADCEHEVESVTSGSRLVLVCFLFSKQTHFVLTLFFSKQKKTDLLPLLLCFPTPSLYPLLKSF